MSNFEKEISKEEVLEKVTNIKCLIENLIVRKYIIENTKKEVDEFISNNNNDLSDEVIDLLYEVPEDHYNNLTEDIKEIQNDIDDLINTIDYESSLGTSHNITSDVNKITFFLECINDYLDDDEDLIKARNNLDTVKDFEDLKKIKQLEIQIRKRKARILKNQGKTNKEIAKILKCNPRTISNDLKEVEN